MFNLINKSRLRTRLELTKALLAYSEEGLRNKWKEKELTEWEFYKCLWALRGKLNMLEDIIKMLE